MKIAHTIMAFIIFCSTTTRLSTMDFLNDPFFKQLAAELDTMFGSEGDTPVPATPVPASRKMLDQQPPTDRNGTTPGGTKVPPIPVIPDSAKDLKTLFIENLVTPPSKDAPTRTFGKPTATTVPVISKERKKAYHHYMDNFVKKIRLIERFVASNPGRAFGHTFLVAFDKVIDSLDQIEEAHYLVLSKKVYLRSFFGQPMQKTRELIVALQPKIDALLIKLRPLLTREESLDDDIARMQQEAGINPTRHHKPPQKPEPNRKKKESSQSIGRKPTKLHDTSIPRFYKKGAL